MYLVRRLALVSGVLAALALAPPALAATRPASGTFVEGPETVTSEQQSGGNLILELTREVAFTGTYTGVGQASERIVVHADGSTNVHIDIAFTGLACGRPAVLEFLMAGQGQLDENFENGAIDGSYSTIAGGQSPTGATPGSGRISGVAGVGGTYEGQVQCD